jgi:hypothetical protein
MARLARGQFVLDEVRIAESDRERESLGFRVGDVAGMVTFVYGAMGPRFLDTLTQLLGTVNDAVHAARFPFSFGCVVERAPHNYPIARRILLLPLSWIGELAGELEVEAGFGLPTNAVVRERLAPEPTSFEPVVFQTVNEIVPAKRRYQEDGECVDDAKDYLDVVREIGALAGRDLEITRLRCVAKGTARELSFHVRGHAVKATLANTGWVDLDPLLVALNSALPKTSKRSFWTYGKSDQSFGVVYVDDREVIKVRDAGYAPRRPSGPATP